MKPEMKEELGQLMKHNPSTGSKFYHLTRLQKECASTAKKIHAALFREDAKCNNEEEPATPTDVLEEEVEPEYFPDVLERKRLCWTPEQEDVMIELFGNAEYDKWHITLIRKVASENPHLRGVTAKQIYDKPLQIKRSGRFDDALGEDDDTEAEGKRKSKVVFTAEQTMKIKDLFRKKIIGKGIITQQNVMDTINDHVTAPDMFREFTPVAKVRYEKSRYRR